MAGWTKKRRAAQARRMRQYWRRVREVRRVENISAREARQYVKRGLFRGVREDASRQVGDRYEARRDTQGRLYVVRTTPKGKTKRVSPDRVEAALQRSQYEALIRRLRIHTGWSSREVRHYLSRYPQWRDGISPLYRERTRR